MIDVLGVLEILEKDLDFAACDLLYAIAMIFVNLTK